jgi:hypothetical protein|tara:strand:+ start:2381 stop:2986 length:606 start_codon:yes stop_codon:yes gene_type:complete
MKKRTYHTNVAFLDLLFNTLLCFAALFTLSFVMINPSRQNANTESKAEFIITVTWPYDQDNDVDVYIEDPKSHLVSFARREDGLMHLDRDDLGHSNDTIQTPDGPLEYKQNREVVSIRGILPGEYIVNVHMYHMNSVEPCPVTIQLDKINPFKIVTTKTVVLKIKADEKTAFRFTVNQNGDVIDVNELPKDLAHANRVPSL